MSRLSPVGKAIITYRHGVRCGSTLLHPPPPVDLSYGKWLEWQVKYTTSIYIVSVRRVITHESCLETGDYTSAV